MTIATVTTDINIGRFKIPANGQNMIMINYAQRNNLAVELAIPEPMKSNVLATLQWLHKERKLSRVILTSIHQLPTKKDELVGIFGRGGFSSQIHYRKLFKEDLLIRYDNGQNIFVIAIIAIYKFFKHFKKIIK